MPVICNRCKKPFRDNQDLNRHLEKKKPCVPFGSVVEEEKWICQPCEKTFSTKGNYKVHLTSKLHERVNGNNAADVARSPSVLSDKEGGDTVSRANIVVPIHEWSVTGVQDLRRAQFYVGYAGPVGNWSNIVRSDGSTFIPKNDQHIFKLGKQECFTGRSKTHTREFGYWQIIDSVITDNPTLVERQIKDDLRNRNELLSAFHRNKLNRDTELFAANMAEYKLIVHKAMENAARCEIKVDMGLEAEITKRREFEVRKAEADSQARIAESNVRLLELQLQLRRLETS